MTWWCVSVGLVIAAFSERTVIFEKVWSPASYMYLPVSGFFYLAAWLPAKVRDILLTFMPSLPCYEMIRGGIFGPVSASTTTSLGSPSSSPRSPFSACLGCATCGVISSTNDSRVNREEYPLTQIASKDTLHLSNDEKRSCVQRENRSV